MRYYYMLRLFCTIKCGRITVRTDCYYVMPDKSLLYLDHDTNAWADERELPVGPDPDNSNRFLCAEDTAKKALERCLKETAGDT